MLQVILDHRCSLRAIARKLRRSASNISRELARSDGAVTKPSAAPSPGPARTVCGNRFTKAHQRSQRLVPKARVACNMVHGNAPWTQVIETLRRGFLPQKASGILQRMPDAAHISREIIYAALYVMPRGELRRQILELLPRCHKSPRPRSTAADRCGLMPRATSIEARPTDINERLVPSHWEGDLINGTRNQSQIGALVARKTLLTVLVALGNATAELIAQRFGFVLNRLYSAMRLSMTYDNGREMAHHQALSQSTGIKVYFAYSYSPWERGINENTKGVLRRTLTKGTDLSVHNQADLDAIALHHNAKPRKSMGWKSPAKLFLPPGSFDFQAYRANIIKPVVLVA